MTTKAFPLPQLFFLAVLTLCLGWWFGSYVVNTYQGESWQVAHGIITKNLEIRKRTRGGEPKYETHYVYEYSVSDRSYVGEKYALEGEGDYSGTPGPYKMGEKVLVYYNPANPQQALLKRTKFKDACQSLLIPVIIIMVFTIAIWSSNINRT